MMTPANTTGGGRATAIIIGRAGSKGVPGKNARIIAGRPAVAHSVAHALRADCIDDVIVSTDGAAIADAAKHAGARIIMRPAELATDTATVMSVILHAIDAARITADIIVILYANVPVRPDDLIDRAVRRLIDTGADSVQSYARIGKHHPYWMIRLDDEARVTPFIENAIDRRQDLPPLWLPDGGVIAVRRDVLTSADPAHPHSFLGNDRRGIETNEGDVVDIDSVHDLTVAEIALHRAAASEMIDA
ncbi:MAG: acylneuraminate cytidylyltransferase family protein [Phycisphaerales bacterium]|nr:acylneuraminate cytidylyltransferase family protein [Phycisphaerales bacterium]